MRAIEKILERRASFGDADAAKAALAHLRWEHEFQHGRPRSQGDGPSGISITIVDDITGKRAVRIESKQPEQLPPAQEDPTSTEDS